MITEINIPEGVEVNIDKHNQVVVKGSKGTVTKKFTPLVSLNVENNIVKINGKSLAYVNTVKSIISNMMKGVVDGFEKRMKALYAHFPITLEIKNKDVVIKNFQGERHPRKSKIIGDTKVEVKGQNITITGPDKEAVGQTAANLRIATKIKNKDPRIFQDGIYEVLE